MPRYALGIDGGGSKCDAALMDERGAVLAWGRGGPTHVYYDPPEAISASYVEAITTALSGIEGAEIWVAGHLPDGPPREAILAHNALADYLAATEVDTAFASAQEQWGLIVLSGTGSFVHGRTPDGRHLHFGGRGPILDDYGSGYAVGLLGLRAAFASNWTSARRTTLAAAIPHTLALPDLHAVFNFVYRQGISRRQIAALAKVVNAEAESGDQVALDCLHRAADELAENALDLIRELRMGDLAFPLIAIGSIARRSRLWWQRICLRLSQEAPGMRPVIPPVLPAVGAALLALQQMGVDWTPGLISRARETAAHITPDAD